MLNIDGDDGDGNGNDEYFKALVLKTCTVWLLLLLLLLLVVVRLLLSWLLIRHVVVPANKMFLETEVVRIRLAERPKF